MLRSPPWLGWPLWNICVTNDQNGSTQRVEVRCRLQSYIVWLVHCCETSSSPVIFMVFIKRSYFTHIHLYNHWKILCAPEEFCSSCSTSDTRRVNLVTKPVITHERGKDREVLTTRVTRSLVLCVCFVDQCFSFCTFSFGHCVVCSSSKYGFWLPPCYLQTLLPRRPLFPKTCIIDIKSVKIISYDVCYIHFHRYGHLNTISSLTKYIGCKNNYLSPQIIEHKEVSRHIMTLKIVDTHSQKLVTQQTWPLQ
jgi:hypothetical protein